MAVRNLDAFNLAKKANDAMVNASKNAKKVMLLSLLEEIKPFVTELNDMRDTFFAVKKVSRQYAEDVLWKHLTGYTDGKGYDKKYNIDINSHFCISAKYVDYHVNVHITPSGLAIYYHPVTQRENMDWDSVNWKGNNAEEYIKSNKFSEDILDKYIDSVKKLINCFPAYAAKFFELVEKPEF